jgi:hypothetical protein
MSNFEPPVGRPKNLKDAIALAEQRLAAADLSPQGFDGRLTNRQLVFAMASSVRQRISDGEDASKIAEILGTLTGDPLNRETMLSYLREEHRSKLAESPQEETSVPKSKKGPIKPLRGPRTTNASDKSKSPGANRETKPSSPATASVDPIEINQAAPAIEPTTLLPTTTPRFVR